jgi:hypothetical protein
MITFVISLATLLLLSSVVAMFIHSNDYPAYRRTYRAFLEGRLAIDRTLTDSKYVFFRHSHLKDGILCTDHVVYFLKDRDFCLLGNKFIHNHPLLYLDPFTLFWLARLRAVADRLIAVDNPVILRRDHRIATIIK